jgi:hypothetical protein
MASLFERSFWMKRTINAMLRSEYWGQGKTVTALSYTRPDVEKPRRLVIDMEYRDVTYQSPDGDRPGDLLFAFDFLQDAYGELTGESLVKLYQDIASGKFGYDVLIIDNVALFQDELFVVLSDKREALQIAKALSGVYARNRTFLDYKFDPAKPTEFYPFLKSVIKELLLACRKSKVDVIVTTESRNVWKNYGSKAKDDANKPKVLGKTAKALDPWFQFGDVILVLSRIKGNRDDGTAKLTTFPTATLDTFNTKCSLPGLAPEFVFENWGVFWRMIEKREVPNQEDFDKVEIPAAEMPEGDGAGADIGLETIADAKRALFELAVKRGALTGAKDKKGVATLLLAGSEAGLDMDNALAEYTSWVELIEKNYPLPSNGAESEGTEAHSVERLI